MFDPSSHLRAVTGRNKRGVHVRASRTANTTSTLMESLYLCPLTTRGILIRSDFFGGCLDLDFTLPLVPSLSEPLIQSSNISPRVRFASQRVLNSKSQESAYFVVDRCCVESRAATSPPEIIISIFIHRALRCLRMDA